MKIPKLNSLIDITFANISIGLIILVWSKFITKSLIFSILLTIIILIVFNIILKFVSIKKSTKQKITKNFKLDLENYFLTLLSNTKEDNLLFFSSILSPSKIIKNKNLIIYPYESTQESTQENQIIFCPMFFTETLTLDSALKQINLAQKMLPKKIILLCNTVDSQTKIKLENFKDLNIEIYNKDDIFFKIFSKYNTYPKIIFTQKSKIKLNLKTIFTISFKKSNAKNFFLSGLFLFFSSFLIRNNIYYVIFSSFLFFLSFICLFNNNTKSIK